MARVQVALRVADLERSVGFYSSLFGVAPAKRRPGYANFAVDEPAVKLVLIEGAPGSATAMDHLGVEVATGAEVDEATARLRGRGLPVTVEDDVTCCYARQDKVWVRGPGDEPWEVYTVVGDAAGYGADGDVPAMRAPDVPRERAPVACTLEASARADQVGRWQAALAAVTARRAIPGGLRLELDPDRVDLAEITRLAAAEARCCAFLDLRLCFDPTPALEVRAPEGAAEVVADMFGA